MESENKLTAKDKLEMYYVAIGFLVLFFAATCVQLYIDYNEDGFVTSEETKFPNITEILNNYTGDKE